MSILPSRTFADYWSEYQSMQAQPPLTVEEIVSYFPPVMRDQVKAACEDTERVCWGPNPIDHLNGSLLVMDALCQELNKFPGMGTKRMTALFDYIRVDGKQWATAWIDTVKDLRDDPDKLMTLHATYYGGRTYRRTLFTRKIIRDLRAWVMEWDEGLA